MTRGLGNFQLDLLNESRDKIVRAFRTSRPIERTRKKGGKREKYYEWYFGYPQGLSFLDIMELTGLYPRTVSRCLKILLKEGVLTRQTGIVVKSPENTFRPFNLKNLACCYNEEKEKYEHSNKRLGRWNEYPHLIKKFQPKIDKKRVLYFMPPQTLPGNKHTVRFLVRSKKPI